MAAVCGVYAIINRLNGHIYIGSSINIHRRKFRHFRYLKEGIHENTHLQRAYNKYGESEFEFIILETTTPDIRLIAEQTYLNQHVGKTSCYNICHIAGSPAAIGRIKTKDHRDKIAKSLHKFYDSNPQHKEYLASLRKGKLLTTETRQKMKDAQQRGVNHHNSKLNEVMVREIRQKYVPRRYSYGKLAKEYGVDKKTILRIIQGKTWTHVGNLT